MMKEEIRPKILLVTKEPIGNNMNAMGIRYFEFASFLGARYEATLIAPHSGGNTSNFSFTYIPYSLKDCVFSIYKSDVLIVTNPHPIILFVAKFFKKKVVLDLYDPILIENLEQVDFLPPKEKGLLYSIFVNWLRLQIRQSDYFICANKRQRDLWLGVLALLGKLNPRSYSLSKDAKGLISVIPTGIPDKPPVSSGNVLRGIVPGIAETDKILLWVGAPNKWYDEKLLIYFMRDISSTRDDIKLVFVCGSRGASDLLKKNIQLSDSLGLTGNTIFFINEWVPYDSVCNYYLEADLGISLHHCHLETHFSMRNRVLGYLWAGLPVVVTEGDSLAELVTRNGLGVVVKEGNKQELAEAIFKLVDDERAYGCCKDAIRKTLPDYRWGNILSKLEEAIAFLTSDESHSGKSNLIKSLHTLSALMSKCFFYRIRYGIVREKLKCNCSELGKSQ